MSQVNFAQGVDLLKRFTDERQSPLDLILVGGVALQYYGMPDRATADLDAEVKGDVEGLSQFLTAQKMPADLSENFAGWSIVAMPPGYRERAVCVVQDALLTVRVLSPADFVIAKLRRFMDEDVQDALFLVGKHHLTPEAIQSSAEAAIAHSVQDTALFLFCKNVRCFVEMMRG